MIAFFLDIIDTSLTFNDDEIVHITFFDSWLLNGAGSTGHEYN